MDSSDTRVEVVRIGRARGRARTHYSDYKNWVISFCAQYTSRHINNIKYSRY